MPNTGQPIETAASHARASRPMPWRPNGCRPRGLWTSIKQVSHAWLRAAVRRRLRSGRQIFWKALCFGLCAKGSDRPEVVATYILAVVQRNPRGQTRPQTLKLVRPLSAKAEGSVELLVDGFHNLADARRPAPQPLGPTPFASVAFGRADDPRPVTIEPSSVVVLALEALVDHVRSRSCRSCAPEPGVGSSPQGEEGLGQRLVLGGSGGEAEAGDHPRWVDGDEQAKAFVPPQAIGPADVGVASKPSLASALRVPNGHGRGVQSLVAGDASAIWHECQVQGNLLDETHARAHQPIELRAGFAGQGGESIVQAPSSVAVEVALAAEAAPPGEDGQGDHLALREGSFRAGSLFRRMGVAEVVDHNVECSEEGVLKSSMGRFLSL